MINWGSVFTIFLAIVAASLVEHLVIAPRMAHSPAHTVANMIAPSANTIESYVRNKYPNAITI